MASTTASIIEGASSLQADVAKLSLTESPPASVSGSDQYAEGDSETASYEEEDEAAEGDPGEVLRVKKVLYSASSKIQQVDVVQSYSHGNVLLLDGVVMLTEFDEFSYQELIAHLPLAAHPDPKTVLVIGGGDGGVLREVAKWKRVQRVVLVEIDEDVITVSKQFLPKMACGFDDPKIEVIIGDGFEYLKTCKEAFDVIITDSPDPVGPAEDLSGKPYYELLHNALKANGVVCSQGESMWRSLDLVKDLVETARAVFPNVEYAWGSTPTYSCGVMGYVLASKEADRDLTGPPQGEGVEAVAEQCHYWSPEVHRGVFALPAFARRAIGKGSSATRRERKTV